MSVLPVSVVMVIFDEASVLPRSLEAVDFADDLVVVDLGSTDEGPIIAERHGARVLDLPRQPTVEQILPQVVPRARHDWVVRLDPDEVFNETLANRLKAFLDRRDVAVVRLPYQYYFRGRPLSYTVWGGRRDLPVLFHRDRVELTGRVHRGIEMRPGFMEVRVTDSEVRPIAHLWANSWRQLFEKHRRYVQREGPSRHAAGERFSWTGAVKATVRALRQSLFWHDGWRGGAIGIALSIFYATYVWRSHLSLRREEQRAER